MKNFTKLHSALIFLSVLFMLITVQNVHGQPACTERSQNGGEVVTGGCIPTPPIIVSKPKDDRERSIPERKTLQRGPVEPDRLMLTEISAGDIRPRSYWSVIRGRHAITDASLRQLIDKAVQLDQEILRLGNRMSPEQAETYDRRMQDLIKRMDQMSRKKGPAPCMKECDKAYPGWGKGKGWNRFWCKAACLVAAVTNNNNTNGPERTVDTPLPLR